MERSILCPICRRPIDAALVRIRPKVEDYIARILREDNPGWRPAHGVCPECVRGAVVKAIERRSLTSIQAELYTPFPVYSSAEIQLLPTPTRVHANPNLN
jgi:hypothetical protein